MGHGQLIYDICENISAKFCIEAGVAYGWSSQAILSSIHNRKGKPISVDMPMIGQNDYHLAIGFVVDDIFRASWNLMRIPDKNGLKRAINLSRTNNIDLIHYDSDKSYYGRAVVSTNYL